MAAIPTGRTPTSTVPDSFDFRVTDPFAESDTATITINIADVPAPEVEVSTDDVTKDPSVYGLPDGGFMVAWAATATSATPGDGGSDGVFAQRFDANGLKVNRDGTPLTGGDTEDAFQVNTFTLDQQLSPEVVVLADGGLGDRVGQQPEPGRRQLRHLWPALRCQRQYGRRRVHSSTPASRRTSSTSRS